MNTENSIVIEDEYMRVQNHRVCWSAVVAGALVGLGFAFLLHLYSVALGLSVFNSSPQGTQIVALGGLLGFLVGVIASMIASGFLAGYLGRFHYHALHGGVIYGFLTWSLIILLSALCVAPMGTYVSAFEKSIYHTTVVNSATGEVVAPKTTTVTSNTDQTVKVTTPAATVTSEQLACGAWIVFGLFFVGALSCCIGAMLGIRCKKVCVREQTVVPPVV